MQTLTLEIMLQVVYGVADGPRLDELRAVLREHLEMGPVDFLGWQRPRLQRYGRWRRNVVRQQHIDALIRAETEERRHCADLAERDDVLSQLLRHGEELSEAELHDNLITMLVGGHETTATALAWALYELSHDPAELTAAQQAADVNDQRYLEAVVQESLRLHPVIHEVGRTVTEAVELAGHRLPPGTVPLASIGLVHADPELYEQPAAFRPSRFLDGRVDPGSWIPFGGGIRRCIGAAFSLTEGAIVLREILTRYDLEPADAHGERTRVRNLMLVPAHGARVIVTSRQNAPTGPPA